MQYPKHKTRQLRGRFFKNAPLTLALMSVYGSAAAVDLTIETAYDLGASNMSNSTVTVNNGGVVTGDGTQISGSAYDVVLINSGGSLTLDNATISNNIDHPTGTNGRTIAAKGANATATLTNSTITISAQSTNPGTDYAHAFTAGVGAADGGHVEINGGSITASGSKRTVGIQANDGGSIDASNIQITTNGTFGHAVQAYRTPTATEIPTHIDLDHVSITTHGSDYSVGIQAANKGASVTASDTDIITEGTNSFGVESFNGATIALTNGSILTSGTGAAGLRIYGGTLGASTATIEGTQITTSGAGASGILVGDTAEPTGGIVNLSNASIVTTGSNAAAASLNYGSSLTANNSTLVSQKSDGIVMTDNATVNLVGTNVQAAGASLVSNLNSAGRTQDITIGSGSILSVNNGTLLQVNRTTAGMDGDVNLTLAAGSISRGDVIDLDGLDVAGIRAGGGYTNFIVGQGADWIGTVKGIHEAVVEDGGTFIDDGGSPISGSVTGGDGSTIIFNNGATIGGDVIGAGSSFKFSGPTTIGGDVILTNDASLHGGTIAAPIHIGGDVAFNSGSTLGGNLDISGAINGAGGILSPGNSVGTVTVGSVTTFASTYNVEVNSRGHSDLTIISTGNVDLTGTDLSVAQENGNGGYVINHDYTILQTVAGNVTGPFNTAALDSSFANTLVTLDPVKYGAQDVKISLSVDSSKVAAVRPSLSPNQNSTLDGVISVSGLNASADAALQSSSTQAALNQLSGEVHGSTQSALMASGGLLVNTLSKHLRGNVGAGFMAGAPTAQASGSIPPSALPQSAAYPVWAEVVGNRSSLGNDSNTAKARTSLGGLFIGLDTMIGESWRVGGALGVTNGDIKVNDRSSESEVTSYTAAVFGGKSWDAGNGSINFLAGAGFTRHNIDSHRTVTLGGNQKLKADYTADAAQLFTEFGYAVPVGEVSVVEPYLGVAWLNQHTEDFNESGGSAALSGDSRTDNFTTTTLGLRGKTRLDTGTKKVTLMGGIGWRHADGDIDPSRRVSFVQGNGSAFNVAGAPITRNSTVVDLGAEIAVGHDTAMGLSYNGQFGSGDTYNTGALYLMMRF
jgi:outer membrane autotransporter protein